MSNFISPQLRACLVLTQFEIQPLSLSNATYFVYDLLHSARNHWSERERCLYLIFQHKARRRSISAAHELFRCVGRAQIENGDGERLCRSEPIISTTDENRIQFVADARVDVYQHLHVNILWNKEAYK